MASGVDDPARPLAVSWAGLLRERGIGSLLVAAAFGALSTGILNVANDLVAILVLGSGSAQVGILNALESLAFLVFSVPAGWWLDRVDRRRALLWTQALSTLALLSVPLAWLAGGLTFWHLAVVSLLIGTAGVVWGLGVEAMLPQLAGRDRAPSVFSRLQAINTGAGFVAPGVTGALLMVLAAPVALFFAAVLEAVAGLVLFLGGRRARLSPDEDHALPARPRGDLAGEGEAVVAREPRQRFWAGVAEGARFTLRTRPVVLSTAVSAVSNAALAFMTAVQTVYFVRVLGFTPALVGLEAVVVAAAGLLGALVAVPLLDRFRGLPLSALMGVVGGLAAVLLPLAALRPDSLTSTLPLVFGFAIAWNVSAVIGAAGKYVVMSALVPNRLMGRVQSFRRLISIGPVPIFSLLGGWWGECFGLVNALWVFVGMAWTAAVLSLWLWRASRGWDLPAPSLARRRS